MRNGIILPGPGNPAGIKPRRVSHEETETDGGGPPPHRRRIAQPRDTPHNTLPKRGPYLEFDGLSQADIDLAMSRINSYPRESLRDKAQVGLFTGTLGERAAELFGVRRIPADEIVLKPSLLGIVQKTRNLD